MTRSHGLKMRKVATTAKLVGLLAFAAVGMGNSCTGGGAGKTVFTNASVARGSFSSTSGSGKSWRTAQFVDIGASEVLPVTDPAYLDSLCSRHNHNQPLSVINALPFANESLWYYPMAVFSNTAKSFHVTFNREDNDDDGDNSDGYSCAPSGVSAMNAYTTSIADITATSTWVDEGDSSSFTQMDVGQSIDSIRPMTTVDSVGDTTLVYFGKAADALSRRPYGTRYNSNSGAWTIAQVLSDTALTDDPTMDVSFSAGLATDSSDNSVLVWVQNGDAYFNQYRPGIGWRFSGAGFPATAQWHAAGDTVSNSGVDVEFDGYGNGYAAYADSDLVTPEVVAARWNGSVADSFTDGDTTVISTGVALGASYGHPRVFVAGNGAATIFYYASIAANTATMYCTSFAATATAAMGTKTIHTTAFATGVTMQDGQDILRPILAHNGSSAVVGYVLSGVLYVKKYGGNPNCHTWTELGPISGTGTITWADLSINSSGMIAAVVAMADAGGIETVYGTVYETTGWSPLTRLDNDTNFTPGIPAAAGVGPTRPSVSIDSEGNAVATFTMRDKNAALPAIALRRRAATAIFR